MEDLECVRELHEGGVYQEATAPRWWVPGLLLAFLLGVVQTHSAAAVIRVCVCYGP